jgi:hypothetical protein
MKLTICLTAICIFLGISIVPAQSNSTDKCFNLKPALSDSQKFKRAVKCKNQPKNDENKAPLEISVLPQIVRVVNLSGSCQEFNQANSNWVILLDELKEFYTKHVAEFQEGKITLENRLEKLIGVEVNAYKCFIVYDVSKDLLRKTTSKDEDRKFPFTNKGFTCDWFYQGIGCNYGLGEFIVQSDTETIAENKYRKEIERLEFKNWESIFKYLKGEVNSESSAK